MTWKEKVNNVYAFAESKEIMNESARCRKWAKELIDIIEQLEQWNAWGYYPDVNDKLKKQQRAQQLVNYLYKYSKYWKSRR